MAALSIEDLQKKREQFKEQYGIDIATEEGRLLLKNEAYRRNTAKFIDDLVKIEDRDSPGIVIDFNLWPAQKKSLKLFEDERFVIVLKTRQIGFSWLALAYGVHNCIYKPGYSANVIAQTEENSKELIRRVDFILRHLPNWLIVSEDAEEEEKQENITGLIFKTHTLKIVINRPDGEPSVFKGFTSSASSAHGFTANLIILDEWARHPEAEDIWEAAYPTINRPTGGQVIGISTGIKNTFFDDMWQGADWEFGAEKGAGSNLFTGIFLPWSADPRRTIEWYEETKRNMPNKYRSQYPATPSDAFSVGKGAFFTEWDSNIHVPYGKEWYPPYSWRIVGAYDGGYNRASFGWYAISPDGWVIRYREYYPSHIIDPEQAEDIRMLSKDPDGVPEQFDYIVGDTSCWAKNKDSGKSTVEIMEEHGIRPWRQADKDRIMGWRRVHEFLTPIQDEQKNVIVDRNGDPLAKLRFTASCSNFIRIVSGIVVHPNKPDDIDNGQEDHVLDEVRYFCMSRPKPKLSREQRENNRKERQKRINPRSSVTGY
ncbi:MAG: hypothetical protein ACLFPF_07165 [Halanaerobiales bacterium]